MGDPDPACNPRLRLAVDKALAGNMTKDTIERAIKRGSGAADGENFEEVRYEGYGPGGVAVMVDCMTDNRNRTVAEVRHAFTKAGGNLGTDGSVAYQFTKAGILSYPKDSDEDSIMEAALEAGAEDVVNNDDGSVDVLTEPDAFVDIKASMVAAGLEPENAEVTMRADNTITLELEDAEKMIRMLDRLEDLDDVQNVYSNADISEDILEQLG
jgi:YebC/PmpR family DNA-binding regulatory protein